MPSMGEKDEGVYLDGLQLSLNREVQLSWHMHMN